MINKKIAGLSRYPVESFDRTILILSGMTLISSLVLSIYFLELPVHFVREGKEVSRTLGGLLWKARTNRAE